MKKCPHCGQLSLVWREADDRSAGDHKAEVKTSGWYCTNAACTSKGAVVSRSDWPDED